MANPAKKDPVLYISQLQQRNIIKKQRAAVEEEKDGFRRDRESGFELFFKGANEERMRNTSKQSRFRGVKRRAMGHTQSPSRRKWVLPSIPAQISPETDSRLSLDGIPMAPVPSRPHIRSRGSHPSLPSSSPSDLLAHILNLSPGDRRKILAYLNTLERDN
jgi:hypothetical protein